VTLPVEIGASGKALAFVSSLGITGERQVGARPRDQLTGPQLVEGRRVELVGKIQERYGVARDEAERQVDSWMRNMIRQASDPRDTFGGGASSILCWAAGVDCA